MCVCVVGGGGGGLGSGGEGGGGGGGYSISVVGGCLPVLKTLILFQTKVVFRPSLNGIAALIESRRECRSRILLILRKHEWKCKHQTETKTVIPCHRFPSYFLLLLFP